MNRDCKQALARLAKICRDNIVAFGEGYDPRSRPDDPHSRPLRGAKSQGSGICQASDEILTEIRVIRMEHRRKKGWKG